MLKKLLTVSAVAVVLLGAASFASAAERQHPRYVARTIQQAPSRYTIVIVPVWQDQGERAPYSLTGSASGARGPAKVTIPSHPRGPHGW